MALQATVAGLALLAVPAWAAAQDDARLRVIVRAGDTMEPLTNAQVALVELQAGGLTDAEGRFRRSGLLPGEVTVVISSVGYEPVQVAVQLEEGRVTIVEANLRVEPVEQEPIEVRAVRGDTRSIQEFYQRAERGGGGYYLMREDIEQLRPRDFSDLFRPFPSLRLDCSNWDHCELSTRSAAITGVTGDCPIQFYVNGVYQPYTDVNLMQPQHIEGVEIYPRGRGAPGRYTMRLSSRCGVVLVWLRRRQ
ncbi:MAG: carboxypeptidase regulatory-like domain-containing protein [Candidatus Longimicrobiales bacterium M2_2A_002]